MQIFFYFGQARFVQHGYDYHPAELSLFQSVSRVYFFESNPKQFTLRECPHYYRFSSLLEIHSRSCQAFACFF